MDSAFETHPLSPNAIPAWRLIQALGKASYLLLPIGYRVAGYWIEVPDVNPIVFWSVSGLIVLNWLFSVFFLPGIRYAHWRYGVNEHEVELQSGIFIRRRTLIPLSRVQHVDTRQGPVFSRFKLANVMIFTAAGSHSIPALDQEVAENLRRQLSSYAQLATEDV